MKSWTSRLTRPQLLSGGPDLSSSWDPTSPRRTQRRSVPAFMGAQASWGPSLYRQESGQRAGLLIEEAAVRDRLANLWRRGSQG